MTGLEGGGDLTKEQLGEVILSSEHQLYATAKSILVNDQDCADAIQETIVKSFEKLPSLKKDKYVKTWMIRILINECYNITRENCNRCAEDMMEKIALQDDDKPDYSELYRAVESLKEELRIPVVLYYVDDFSVREIAKLLYISEGAVQKRLSRARGKLKKQSIWRRFFHEIRRIKKRISQNSCFYSYNDRTRSG